METTVGKILLKHHVPEHLKSFVSTTTLDKKGLGQLFGKLSEGSGETYKDITTGLARLGFETSTRLGSTVPLADLSPLDDKDARFDKLELDIKSIKAGVGTKKEKEHKLGDLYNTFTNDFDAALMAAGKSKNHTLSKVIMSGARGSLQQYRNTTGAVILVNDAKGKPLTDFPIRNSFADGLSVPEYLLHSYGTRIGAIDTKLSVADSGYMSKQLARATMPIIIEEHDCGTDAGIPISTSNTDMIGSYLAKGAGTYNKNNEVTIAMLANLKEKGITEILIRSPITCKAAKRHHFGAVCQLCVGKREKGRLPEIGDYVGISAAAPLGEGLCAAKGTRVRTPSGYVNIEDIKVGDSVYGCSMEGQISITKVVNTFVNGVKPVNKYSFRKGSGAKSEIVSVTTTEDHKIFSQPYVNHKFLPIQKLAAKYIKNAQLPLSFDDTGLADEPFALLAGLMIGDGTITKNSGSGLFLTCADEQQLADTREYLASLNLSYTQQHKKICYRIVSVTPQQQLDLPEGGYVRNELKQWLIAEELYGCNSGTKKLPKNVAKWSNKSVWSLLAGLIATDGWVSLFKKSNSVVVGYSSKSFELISGVKELLELRLGIYGARLISKVKKRKEGGVYDPVYELNICNSTDVEHIYNNITIPGVKYNRLRDALAYVKANKVRKDQFKPRGRINLLSVISAGEVETFDIEVEHKDHMYVVEGQLVISNSQGTLNSKHTSSSAGGGKSALSGFKLVQQLANIPKTFQSKAAVAVEDGRVKIVRKLAQGGLEIVVDNGLKDHVYYVPSGLDAKVKPGAHVEEGDVLSEGIINAADIVRHKGIGEGRRFYADMMHDAFRDSGMGVNHRNFQVLAKGAIDHVKIIHPEGVGSHLPDSIVSYQSIEKDYKTRPDSKTMRVDLARGKYLEEPVLHYSIGTRIVTSVINYLRSHGVESIVVNDNPPPFEPEMQRLLDVPGTVPDFAHWLYSAYLEKKLIKAVNEGATSNLKGPSPIMGLAYGVGFGQKRASDDSYEFEYAEDDPE